MIITGAWTAAFAVLAGLGTGDPWTAVAAIFLAAMLLITLGDPQLREFALMIDGLFISAFRRRPAPVLPGPGKPQASGVSQHEDTTIEGWTPAQMAFIRGDTDELPGTDTLPGPADIPEENPS